MAIWEVRDGAIHPLDETTFSAEGVRERDDLQRVLRDNVKVIAHDTLVIAEEYGDWADSRRRIDLLGIDTQANLVVIELKRTEDGGHMDLQAIRYAAMVSTLTFAKAVQIFQEHLTKLGRSEDARALLLEFLSWEEPKEEEFATDVRIILASAEFSKEITTAVIWLNDHGIDIRCVRLKPYRMEGRLLLDVQQVLPLPEATEYQVQVREKEAEKRQARVSNADFTRYDLQIKGKEYKALGKRHLVYRAVRAAIENGTSPESLAPLIPRGPARWVVMEGNASSDEFREHLRTLKTPSGGAYEPRRYFLEEDELIRHNGRTYAFSNQWGGEPAFQVIRDIAAKYPALALSLKKSTSAAGDDV
jgi:hypothetical protein